jgi:hypothetical protein
LWQVQKKVLKKVRSRAEFPGTADDDESTAEEEAVHEPENDVSSQERDAVSAVEDIDAEDPTLLLRVAELLKDCDVSLDESNLYQSLLEAVEAVYSGARAEDY